MIHKTDIQGFDDLFEKGGLLEENIYLIKGAPGSGKTTLGMEFIYNGVKNYKHNGLIISFEEAPQQLYRDGQNFGWDLLSMEKSSNLKVICTSPGTLMQDSFIGAEGYLQNLIREMGVKRIFLDSITHFRRISANDIEFRENLYKLISSLKIKGITVLLSSEFDQEISISDYVVDGVIYLRNNKKEGRQNRRTIEIFKSRGQGHISGEVYFEIEDGIKVYHFERNDNDTIIKKDIEYIEIGVENIKTILKNGFVKGTFNILVGSAGTGKTVFGTNFLKKGIQNKEAVLYLSFEESKEKYYQFMENLGLDIENDYFHFKNNDFETTVIEKFIYDIDCLIKEKNITRVVIDTLNTMFFGIDVNKKRMYLNRLKYMFENNNVTVLGLLEEDKIVGELEISEEGYIFLADSIIMMRYLEVESDIRRIITVLKARGLNHDKKITEYNIEKDFGVVIKDKLLGLSGILSGVPKGVRKESIDEIFQPLVFLESFTDYMEEEMNSQDRKELGGNMKDVIKTLKDKLLKYFDIKEGDSFGI